MRIRHLSVMVLVLSAIATNPAATRAETINCTAITTVPAVITVPGIYCLTTDLTTAITNGSAIDIEANNVVLDMNGHRLGGLAAGLGTQAIGIFAANRQNITVRNGTIRGFLGAIFFDDSGASQGHIIEEIRADQNRYLGLAAQGTGNIIRNNQVVATGGTTGPLDDPHIPAIVVFGNGNRVVNNDIVTVIPTGGAPSVGIGVVNGSGNVVLNNRITSADQGILFDGATGKFRDNLTSSVTTPYTGGTDAGNNN